MQDTNRLILRSGAHIKAASLAPDAPFWAIGDVHGCYDLLAPLLDALLRRDEQIVLLGDYINKGPQSAKTLQLIHQATQTGRVIALRGNHEELLLRFLERPRLEFQNLRSHNGGNIFASFGLPFPSDAMTPRDLSQNRNALRDKMGDIATWLATCPNAWHSGNITALHAGADPQCALGQQPEKAFVWGHPLFEKIQRADGQWVVHGHRPVAQITVKQRRIALETQAHVTGRLSAVRISQSLIDAC